MIHIKLPEQDDLLGLKLREEARTVFLQKKSRELLNNTELQVGKKLFCLGLYGLLFFFAEPLGPH